MMDQLEHCGWVGSVEFSQEDGVLHGKLLNTRDLISYEGETVAELIRNFQETVEDYIDFCLQHGKPVLPQNTTNVAVKLEIYRQVADNAHRDGLSFEDYLEASILRGMNQLKAS